MTWLVVASEQDFAAHWAADRLRATGISPITVVTDIDLARATWRHHSGDNGFHTEISLADGRVVDSAAVRGTLNRLTHVPSSLVAGIVQEDRAYAQQEMTALLLSWLASIPGTVLNPADPRGLCGAWRSAAEWALLAGKAGFSPIPISSDPDARNKNGSWQTWPPFAPVAEDVIMVGTAVFANSDLPPATLDACRNLAVRANTPILGFVFNGDYLAGVTPLPDLRAGGDDLIAALVDALGEP